MVSEVDLEWDTVMGREGCSAPAHELKQLSKQQGRSGVLNNLPPLYIARLLHAKPPRDTLATINTMHRTLETLIQWEAEADQEKLRELFDTKRAMVSQHKDGRPILWFTDLPNTTRNRRFWKELILFQMWLFLWAPLHKTTPLPRACVVMDWTEKKILDFDMDYVRLMAGVLGGLFPLVEPEEYTFYYICKNRFVQMAVHRVCGYLPKGYSTLEFIKRDRVRELCAKPNGMPVGILKGDEPRACVNVGDAYSLDDGRGFRHLTIRSIFRTEPLTSWRSMGRPPSLENGSDVDEGSRAESDEDNDEDWGSTPGGSSGAGEELL